MEGILANSSSTADNASSPTSELYIIRQKGSTALTLGGPVQLIICSFVTIVNILFLIVLSKKEMRSVTSVLLMSISACDLVMGVSSVPIALYFSLTETLGEPVPYSWCYVIFYRGILPQITHTASIWLTLTLGVFRYLSVCHPLKAPVICSFKRAVKAVIVAGTLPVIIYGMRFFEVWLQPLNYTAKDNTTYAACSVMLRDWITPIKYDYYMGLYVFRAVFTSLLPCFILSIITIRLIYALKMASRNRRNLGTNYQDTESQRTSILLVTVLLVFLIIEIPTSLLMIVHTFASHLLDFDKDVFVTACNDFVVLSCAFNFCIHCAMGKKFRQAFKTLCVSKTQIPLQFTDM